MFFIKPPKIEKLLGEEYYQARREVIGQQEKVHRLRVVLAQAEAALVCYENRELFLAAQIESGMKLQNPLNVISSMEQVKLASGGSK